MSESKSPQLYYRAAKKGNGYKGQLYCYDDTGNRVTVTWETREVFHDKDEAINAVAEYMDEQGIDAEGDFS